MILNVLNTHKRALIRIFFLAVQCVILAGCYSATELYQQARLQMTEGKVSEAISKSSSAIEKYKKEIEKSFTHNTPEQTRQLHHTLFQVYLFRGNAFFQLGDVGAGKADYLSALTHYSVDDHGIYNKLWILLETGSWKTAEVLLKDRSKSFEPQIVERLKAVIAYERNESDQAREYFLNSMDLGLAYNFVLVNHYENDLIRSSQINLVQQNLKNLVEQYLQKQELELLETLKTPLQQWIYLKSRMAYPMGEFGIPQNYVRAYKHIFFTTTEIIVTHEDSQCQHVIILGIKCLNRVFAGKVMKNDMVYVDGYYLRSLHTVQDLGRIGSENNEAYGNYQPFMENKGLRFSEELFTRDVPLLLSVQYIPTAYRTEYSDWKGGLMKFIQEHPVATLVMGAVAIKTAEWMLSPSGPHSGSAVNYSCKAVKSSCLANCEQMSNKDAWIFTTRSRCIGKCKSILC
ncbi:MAG: hypothetical protein HQM12_17375 [SAR324 cluster bacterium]|nr:hypothetical protein [SAR324 cluster bacterium]